MMICLKNINKTFTTKYHEVKAVVDVDLEIKKGEFVAITGTSGCGKTTLLNIIGMQDTADSGLIYINGSDISTLKAKEKHSFQHANIAMIFQFFNLIDVLTMKENILLPLKLRKKQEDENKLNTYVKRLGLEEHLNHFPSECSGGQQQRVALIRALMNEVPIILADEPTGNLDRENAKEVIEILKQINLEDNVTIVMVTHDHELAMMADKQIVMKDGRIINGK